MTGDRQSAPAIELGNGQVSCRVQPELGGALLSLEIAGASILRTSPGQPADILQSACFPLIPFANRIAQGRFEFGGRQIALPADPATPPHAHHGHGWRRPWQIVSRGDDHAELAYGHEGGAWPWTYRARQHLQLLGDGIALSLELENTGDRPIPCGFGFHPYFDLAPDSYLSASAPSRLCPDQRGIPCHVSRGLVGQHRLADLPPSDDFLLEERDRVLIGTGAWEVALCAGEAAGWQFYLPEDRQYFCLEPVSHRPDSFNLPGPIETVQPGSCRSWHFTIRRTR